MYKVDFVSIENFQTLKEAWLSLQNGRDMTYFQSYDWYEMLSKLNPDVRSFCEIVFAQVLIGQRTMLIAPLFIVKTNVYANFKKGIYFFGNQGWNDYCNIIYDQFCEDAVEHLFNSLKNRYGITRLFLDFLKNDTLFYNYLEKHYKIHVHNTVSCVELNMPESIDSYFNLLSRNSKNSIHKAINHAKTDGVSFDICYDDTCVNMTEFKTYRDIRVSRKNGEIHKRKGFKNILHYIKKQINNIRYCYFRSYTPFDCDHNCKFMTIKDKGTGNLCAAINYGYSKHRKEIVIMAVSMNDKYKRYSPGIILLYNYIQECIRNNTLKNIDFTRGDERYKFMLGGKSHLCNCISIDI